METINYEKLRKAFDNLPKDYARIVKTQYPTMSSSRIQNIRALVYTVDESKYKPGSRTISVFISLLEISKEHTKKINLLK